MGSSDLTVSHLQYADDTIIMVESSYENLWSIQTILCVFKLALCLRVNFSKSSLVEVKFDTVFLDLAYHFLHCHRDSLSFKYLGLLEEVDPRLPSMWEPLVSIITRRLHSLRHRYVSLVG